MTHIKTLGIDLGKTSFHVIGWDEQERQVKKAKYNRSKLIEFITLNLSQREKRGREKRGRVLQLAGCQVTAGKKRFFKN